MPAQSRHQPFALSRDELVRVREVFDLAGFDQRSVAETCGAAGISRLTEVTPQSASLRASSDSPLHVLIRLFVIGMACPAGLVRNVIAPASVETWITGGLLLPKGDELAAAVKIAPVDGLLLGFDRVWAGQARELPDHVMGPSNSARTLANLTIRGACDSALDLGTGCGYLAFLLARHSRHVTATDINPRATAFTRFNAGLNGVDNVEALTGDRFGPVEGRKFDLVVSNPPFIISPEKRLAYLSGGMRADEFTRAVAREVPRFLQPGGYCQMTANWAERKDQDWTERLREWFEGCGCDVWVLRSSTTDPLNYALEWMAIGESGQGTPALQRLEAWTQYLSDEGIASVGGGVLTMRRRQGNTWYRALDGPAQTIGPAGAQVLERLRVFDMMHGRDDDWLFSAVFAACPDVMLTQECRPREEGWVLASATLRITSGLGFLEQVDNYVAELVAACDGKRALGDAVAKAAARFGWGPDEVPQETADIVRQLVEEGFLIPTAR